MGRPTLPRPWLTHYNERSDRHSLRSSPLSGDASVGMSRTMLAERWQEITRVYNEALARDIETRAAFVAQVCAGDEVLRREVELLLAQAASAEAVLAESPADVSAQM